MYISLLKIQSQMRKNLLFSLLSLLFINTLAAQYLLPNSEIEQVGNSVNSVNNEC
jgi:hypothetical protein